MIIGLPVLHHLKVDNKTLLEQNRGEFDGTDCSAVNFATPYVKLCSIGRMMRASAGDFEEYYTALDPQRPIANYYAARNEEDLNPDPSLIDVRHDN